MVTIVTIANHNRYVSIAKIIILRGYIKYQTKRLYLELMRACNWATMLQLCWCLCGRWARNLFLAEILHFYDEINRSFISVLLFVQNIACEIGRGRRSNKPQRCAASRKRQQHNGLDWQDIRLLQTACTELAWVRLQFMGQSSPRPSAMTLACRITIPALDSILR